MHQAIYSVRDVSHPEITCFGILRIETTARCALTFLPITEPGISKYCRRCKREFLDEERLLHSESKMCTISEQDRVTDDIDVSEAANDKNHTAEHERHLQNDENPETRLGLVQKLFMVFESCPYCGGRFFTPHYPRTFMS